MEWSAVAFYLIAAVCVLSAAGVVISTNPLHSAVFLILCFLNIAATFVMMGAEFLAVVQVIVYTGAILVLMLFVMMLIDPEALPEFHSSEPVQRIAGLVLGLILLLEVGAAITARSVQGTPGDATPDAVRAVGGNTQALGRVLYDDNLLAFIVISLVLTVAVIGAVVLALPERAIGVNKERRRDTISLGHPVGTDAEPLALPTLAGEAPVPAADSRELMPVGGERRLILVRDPDVFTEGRMTGDRPVGGHNDRQPVGR